MAGNGNVRVIEYRYHLRFNQRNTLLLLILANYKNRFPACQTVKSELEIQRDLTNRKALSRLCRELLHPIHL